MTAGKAALGFAAIIATLSGVGAYLFWRGNHPMFGGYDDQPKELTPLDFDPVQLHKGTAEEMGRTDDWRAAQETAMDHLADDPIYYRKLAPPGSN